MTNVSTVCVVDDDSTFQYLACRGIEQTNLVKEVKKFGNGLEAINFLRSVADTPEKLPEIILLDLNMPVMDGWEFMKEFITLKPSLAKEVVVYIVSSSISQFDINRAMAIADVKDYVIKPITKERFIELMRKR